MKWKNPPQYADIEMISMALSALFIFYMLIELTKSLPGASIATTI
jgi:hypothetical protein